MAYKETPSQTIGPFFAYGLTPAQYGYPLTSLATPAVADASVEGEQIRIQGRVFDGNGDVVNDAMIEVWQADAQGRYAHPADARRPNADFNGFGRTGTGTDPQQRFWFDTVKPGSIDAAQAPHINVIVFMRGLLNHLYTRIYFADESVANAGDAVFNSLPPDRRVTLLAERSDTPRGVVYGFDIHMQGALETVFFDY